MATEIFFTKTISSGTATTSLLPSSLQTLTAYSTKLWEKFVFNMKSLAYWKVC